MLDSVASLTLTPRRHHAEKTNSSLNLMMLNEANLLLLPRLLWTWRQWEAEVWSVFLLGALEGQFRWDLYLPVSYEPLPTSSRQIQFGIQGSFGQRKKVTQIHAEENYRKGCLLAERLLSPGYMGGH